jgi:hypothetical protein
MSSDTPYSGRMVSGEIQYIHHFGDNVTVEIDVPGEEYPVLFTGAAGVLIFESDHAIDDSEWAYTGSGDFTANYYYGGVLENGTLTSVQMGIAATRTPPIATPCFTDLDNAIAAFDSVGSLQTYISEPAEYLRTVY